MSLVVVGSVAYDGVETPHGKVDRMLGGACTYIALAASYFTRVNIVGVVGEDFAQQDYDFLAGRGIDLSGLERVKGKTFFWSGLYSADMNDRTTPLKYRFLVAMQGSLGIGANLSKWSGEDFKLASEMVAHYKSIRQTVRDRIAVIADVFRQ